MRIAVDLKGGDPSPLDPVPCARRCAQNLPDVFLTFCGQPHLIEPARQAIPPALLARVTFVPAAAVRASGVNQTNRDPGSGLVLRQIMGHEGPKKYNGATLSGVDGIVAKRHGCGTATDAVADQ